MNEKQRSPRNVFWLFVDNLYFELCCLSAVCCTYVVQIIKNVLGYTLHDSIMYSFSAFLLVGYGLCLVMPYVFLLFIFIRRLVRGRFVPTLLLYRLGKVISHTPRLLIAFVAPVVLAVFILFGKTALSSSPIVYNRYAGPLAVILIVMSVLVLCGLLDQLSRVILSVRALSSEKKLPEDRIALYRDTRDTLGTLSMIDHGLDEALQERVKAERFKTELIANVSHDIKTPLTSIVSYVELLKKEPWPDEKVQGYLDILSRNAWRLGTLANDLVEASKTSTGNVDVNMQSLALVELVSQVYGEFDGRFSERKLQFVFDGEQAERYAAADGAHLWRVLENLFSNAVKYATPQTRIYCDITSRGDSVCLVLKNISADPLNISADELMERFVRGDVARHTEGSGLGLFIARSLMLLMGGQLQLRIDGDLFEVKLTLRAANPPVAASTEGDSNQISEN